MSFSKLIKENTIFICGEDEILHREIIDLLLASGIKHFYFINPNDSIKKYFDKMVDKDSYSIVSSINEVKFGENNIIACGFKPISPEFINKLKEFKHSITIFFNRNLGIFRTTLTKIKNIEIIDKSLSEFLSENIKKEPDFAPNLSNEEKKKPFFANRGPQLDHYREFVDHLEKRCCKIIGMKGMGKGAFINELKRIGLQERCFEFHFVEKSDSFAFLLEGLLERFKIPYSHRDIEREIESRRPHLSIPIIRKLFEQFDKIEGANIIFYNIEQIYNRNRRKFFNQDIELFFHYLVQRDTYRQNKIYMVSSENFDFSRIEDNEVVYTIKLEPFQAFHIKLIIERAFSDKKKSQLGRAVMRYDDETIDKLISGHPVVAKLFVEMCDRFGLNEVINDELTRKKFEEQKILYLMDIIQLDEAEKKMLEYLALFKANCTLDAIKEFDVEPLELILKLQDTFLIEMVDFSTHSEYYVPSLIKDYIIAKMDERTFRNNHNTIARFYWSKAEDINTPPTKVLEFYRLALYHYSQPKNYQKENELILRFEGIFLNKARESYRKRDYKNAWHYYHELYQNSKLNEMDLENYLRCNALLHKAETENLYEKAISDFQSSYRLKFYYAKYLFYKKSYTKAEAICLEVLKIDEAKDFYPRILSKTGKNKEAIVLIEKRIKYYKSNSKINNRTKKKLLIGLYLCYYSVVRPKDVLKLTIIEVLRLLKKDDVYFKEVEKLLRQKIESNVDKIEEAFEKAINHEIADKAIYNSYYEFLKRQNSFEKANEILQKKIEAKPVWTIQKRRDKMTSSFFYEEIIKLISVPQFEQVEIKGDPEKETIIKAGQRAQAENHLMEIMYKIEGSEQILHKGKELLQNVLVLEPNNYSALAASPSLLISSESLNTLKKIVNICYDKELKENFLRSTEKSDSEEVYSKTNDSKESAMKAPCVFISYSHADKDTANFLKDKLQSEGIDVIIDSVNMKAGRDFIEFINDSVAASEVTLFIVSNKSLLSGWVAMETVNTFYHRIFKKNKKFIACYIDNDFFSRDFTLKKLQEIDREIKNVEGLIQKHAEEKIDSSDLNAEKTRLYDLRNNLNKIVAKLKDSLCIDIRGAQLTINYTKIIEAIKS